jgi:hypothetical protein
LLLAHHGLLWRLLLRHYEVVVAACCYLLHLHLRHLLQGCWVWNKHLLIHKCCLLQLLQLVGINLELAKLLVLKVYELAHCYLLVLIELGHEVLLLSLIVLDVAVVSLNDRTNILLLVCIIAHFLFLAW